MRRIYDVKCEDCSKVTEAFGHADDVFSCGECGGSAKRIISPVQCKLNGSSGDFPRAARRWAREHTKAGQNNG